MNRVSTTATAHKRSSKADIQKKLQLDREKSFHEKDTKNPLNHYKQRVQTKESNNSIDLHELEKDVYLGVTKYKNDNEPR